MKRFCLAALLFAVGISPCRARLGETVDQCIDRYGPVIEKQRPELPASDPETSVFSKNSVTVIVEFQGGKAWRITFRKPKLAVTEIEALLTANAAAGTWSPPLRYGDRDYRLGSDRARLAVTTFAAAGAEASQLEIMSRDYTEKLASAARASIPQPATGDPSKPKTNPLPGF